ncbi:MAG: SGNH/GDSL hydrolase family protein, partial [Roseibacillus sp.]|nr:SGNH/GDSL hydrolase family protein [Roseibacillus sp.]
MKKIIFIILLGFLSQFAQAGLSLREGDRILLYGNSFIERLQTHGLFEASLQLAHPEKNLECRSLAWTGDEVGYRLRPERYVNHLKKLLNKWPANVVILGFGSNESFAGPEGTSGFRRDLDGYIDEIQRRHPGVVIVVLSPIATENLKHPHYPDTEKRNAEIRGYVEVMREVAARQEARFVDLFAPSLAAYARQEIPLTSNGIHLNDAGYGVIANHLAQELLGPGVFARVDQARAAVVARAVTRKAEYVASVVRPVNTVLYFGVRGRAHEYNAEIPRYHELIARSDARIHAMLKDASIQFDSTPLTLSPLVERAPAKLPS